jgi:CBS domain-containing protein
MTTPLRVDFHCHSTCSDGALSPEKLADKLADAGVAYAALADHDTLDGLDAFRKRLATRGVGFLTGVEMTVQWRGREAHLLGFGFDPDHAELRAALASIRQSREPGEDSIAGSVRKSRLSLLRAAAPPAVGPDGRLGIEAAIDLIHRAGGSAFLAHPLLMEADLDRLDTLLPDLKAAGLDGIEALYSAFTPGDRERLCEMARRRGLLVSAGSDFHNSATGDKPGEDMPRDLWKAFRDAILSGSRRPAKPFDERDAMSRPRRLRFIVRIVLPAVIAMALFALALLDIILPAIERSLLDRKREMIRELVNSAWGILAEAEQEVQSGITPLDQAQFLAKKRIETLRYGREGKDYFWLQDMHPRILMHPYRPDLNGQDVSDYRDARGARLFVEFADLVRRQNEGFLDYVWQWKDDPQRLVPKESYIRGFTPWGWIIGTGLYVEDVQAEIARFERHLILISWGIAGLIALLLLFVIRQSLLLERKRREAEAGLRESNERYRALVEAATEGTLLLVEGRCRYANPTLLRRLGYAAPEIELLDLADILPPQSFNEKAWVAVRLLRPGEERATGIESVLKARDGKLLECLLFLSRISVAGKDGLVLQARDLTQRHTAGPEPADVRSERDRQLAEAAANVPVGLFRARALQRPTLLEANRAAVEFLPALGAATPGGEPPSLADVFPDGAAFDDFRLRLERDGVARQRLHAAAPDGGTRTLTLEARLMRDEAGAPRTIDGLIEDATGETRREEERDALIERLQTSLLYLHEPVERLCRPAAFCEVDTPIREAAALMTAQDSEAALVRDSSGALAGIITDRLLRTRALGEELTMKDPVSRVMRESIPSVPRSAQVYEALLLMQEKGVEHLAVTEDGGGILGLIHSRDILQLHSSEAASVTRTIARAATPDEAAEGCRRTPALVRSLLETGAHARQITRLINAVGDAATVRFIELALAGLGPAPRPFAFLALGSQGRFEPTLLADQDNALLYAPAPAGAGEAAEAEVARYFLELGARVCDGLERAGYPACRGGIMARNPAWCAALPDWKKTTADWIRGAAPKEVMDFNIFLDFRPVYGDIGLARELRRHVRETLRETPAFLPFLARDLLRFEPPPAWFVRLLHPGRHSRAWEIDLKAVMMPVTGFARLYALQHEVDETHTLGRLEALARRNLVTRENLKELATAYDSLLSLRLRHQVDCLREGRPLDNTIDRRRLDRLEQSLLRQAYERIAAIQRKISYDFLGGT